MLDASVKSFIVSEYDTYSCGLLDRPSREKQSRTKFINFEDGAWVDHLLLQLAWS